MLFSQKVDDEIKLVFLQKSMAQELNEHVIADAEYLSEWLPWVGQIKTIADSEKFIKESTESFAAYKSLNVAILFEGEIVGVTGYNSIRTDLKKVVIGYWLLAWVKISGQGHYNPRG